MLENFPHFAVLVLLVYVTGLSNRQSALGATIFFWARLAPAALYLGGLWRLRWIAFFTGVAGEILIFLRLI